MFSCCLEKLKNKIKIQNKDINDNAFKDFEDSFSWTFSSYCLDIPFKFDDEFSI